MICNLRLAVRANSVDGIDCYSFDVKLLRVGALSKLDKQLYKLMIVIRKLILNMKDDANETLQQLLLALVALHLQNAPKLVCDLFKTV